jgi:UDP-N-acetylmuramoylalanine--D-glutamate ligase
LPHRVELVGEYNGVKYYDDSKGTNVGAVIKSLEGFAAPIILIAAAGQGRRFRGLKPLVSQKVKVLILLGEAKDKIADVLSGATENRISVGHGRRRQAGSRKAAPGDVVLLSPACASFDMFQDYGHRGRFFAQLAREAK